MENVNLIKQGTGLYIKNLDNCIDDERLRKEFSSFGTVITAKVMKKLGKTNGFGFVCFSTSEQAKLAMAKMNGRFLGSLPIYVVLAHCSSVANETGSSSQHFALPNTESRNNQVSEAAMQGITGPWWPEDACIKENKAKTITDIHGQEYKAPPTSSLYSDIGAQGYSQKRDTMTEGNPSCTEAQSYNKQRFPLFGPDVMMKTKSTNVPEFTKTRAVTRPIVDCPPSDRYWCPVVPSRPSKHPFSVAEPRDAPRSNTVHQLPLVEQGFMMNGRYGTDLPTSTQEFAKSKTHTMTTNSGAVRRPPNDGNKYPQTVPSKPYTDLLPVAESRKAPKNNAVKKLPLAGQKVNMNARYQTDPQSSTQGLPKPKKRSTTTVTATTESGTVARPTIDWPPFVTLRPNTGMFTKTKPKETTTTSNAAQRSHQGQKKPKHKKNQQPSTGKELPNTKKYVTMTTESNVITRPAINWQSANRNPPPQPYTDDDLLNIQLPLIVTKEATTDELMSLTDEEYTNMQLQSFQEDMTARAILERELINIRELARRGALTVIRDSYTSRYVLSTDFSIKPTLADQFIMSERNNAIQRSIAQNLQRELELLNIYEYPPAQRLSENSMMTYNIPRPMGNPNSFYMQNYPQFDSSNALREINVLNMQRILLAEHGIINTPENNIANLGMYNMQEFSRNEPGIMQNIGNNFMPQPFANYMHQCPMTHMHQCPLVQQETMMPTGHNRGFQPTLNQDPFYMPMITINEPGFMMTEGIGSMMAQEEPFYVPNLPLANDVLTAGYNNPLGPMMQEEPFYIPRLPLVEEGVMMTAENDRALGFTNNLEPVNMPEQFPVGEPGVVVTSGNGGILDFSTQEVPFYTPIIPLPEEDDIIMTSGYTNNIEPVNMPLRLPVGEPGVVMTPGNCNVPGFFTYQDPAKMSEFLGDGQGVIMAAQNSTVLTTQESAIFHEQVANQGTVITAGPFTNHSAINMDERSVNEEGVMITAGNPTLPRTNPGPSSNIQVIPLVAQGLVLTGGNRTVSFQFTPNVRNIPKAYCYWQPAAPARIKKQESLTLAMLATVLPHERRELLGERLYPLVQGMYSDMAGKITGMLLGLDDIKLLHLLENIGCLRDKVDEAVAVLRAYEAR